MMYSSWRSDLNISDPVFHWQTPSRTFWRPYFVAHKVFYFIDFYRKRNIHTLFDMNKNSKIRINIWRLFYIETSISFYIFYKLIYDFFGVFNLYDSKKSKYWRKPINAYVRIDYSLLACYYEAMCRNSLSA